MKPLEELNNVERAKLLHQLFPKEIPAFISYAKNVAEITIEQQDEHRSKWNSQLFSVGFWLSLARHTVNKINQYGKKLEKSSGLFSDQLFDGYNACFMSHCLQLFTTIRRSESEKFNTAVKLLFD